MLPIRLRAYEVHSYVKAVASRPYVWYMNKLDERRSKANPSAMFEKLRVYTLKALTALQLYFFWQLSTFSKVTLGGLVLLLLSHELNHFIEMRHYKIPVKEIGIGLPIGIFKKLQYRVKIPGMETRVMLSPLIVAAYVDEGAVGRRAMHKAGPKAMSAIIAGGPAVNIATGVFLFGLLPLHGVESGSVNIWIAAAWALGGWSLAAAMYIYWRRGVATMFMPALGAFMVIMVAVLVLPPLWSDFWAASANGASFAGQPPNIIGPVGMVKLISLSNDLLMAHLVLTILALSLGMSNLLPVKLFDGAQLHAVVLDRVMTPVWRNRVLTTTTILLFGPLLFVMIRTEFEGTLQTVMLTIAITLLIAGYIQSRLNAVRSAIALLAALMLHQARLQAAGIDLFREERR